MKGCVVDTCVLLDVFEGIEPFASRSADVLDGYADKGLVVAPITYIELAPAFRGNLDDIDEFLRRLGIRISTSESVARIKSAARLWAVYVELKRQGAVPRRPMADLLIGACALEHEGLITRNGKDFRNLFPTLVLVEP